MSLTSRETQKFTVTKFTVESQLQEFVIIFFSRMNKKKCFVL